MRLRALALAAPLLACAPAWAQAEEATAQGLIVSAVVEGERGGEPVAGQPAAIRLSIRDAETGRPYDGARPAAWLDPRESGDHAPSCKAKIEAFMQGGLARRPRLDLNAWYVLALDDRGGVTVIDPLGGFGGTQVVTRVPMDGVGEDWAMDEQRQLLLVTLPEVRRVAVIDTRTWKVARHVALPWRPHRAALKPGSGLLWVSEAGGGGKGRIRILKPESGETVAELTVGTGPHAIAFGQGSALVTNGGDGTVTLVDASTHAVKAVVPVGKRPVAVAHSPLARAFAIADEQSGAVTLLGDEDAKRRTKVKLGSGLVDVGVAPGGRWVFAADGRNGKLHILDASTGKLWRTISVPGIPYQISFTQSFAYLRLAKQGAVGLVALAGLGEEAGPAIQVIPAGQSAPASAGRLETAAALAPVPTGNGALIGNPADRAVYYYMEGAVAPVGSFSTGKSRPRGLLMADRSLRRSGPGTFETTLTMPAGGTFDLAVLLEQPRLWHCFTANVKVGPEQAAGGARVRFLNVPRQVPANVPLTLRFEVAPEADGAAFEAMATLVPGTWRQAVAARQVGPRTYEASIQPPKPGAYFVYLSAPSLRWQRHELPFATLTVKEPKR